MENSIFSSHRLLFEADDEDEGFSASDNQTGESDDDKSKSSEQNNDNKDEDTKEDDSEDSKENDKDGETNDEDNNEDNEDFSIDSEDEEETNDGDTDSSDNSEDNKPIENEDKERDRELFDSLSPQEQKLKTVNLKKMFLELYSNCDHVVEKINNIDTSYEDLNIQIKKALAILYDLKQMISDYTLSIFDSKSYIDNDIMFNRYLAILNSVKSITIDINNFYDKENDKDNK